MTTSDGYVIGTTKIVDNGPSSRLWDLVILGDGYQASEMDKYHSDVQSFVDHFRVTAPFNQLWCRINVYRVDVVSTDSGADDPVTCGDDSPGTTGSGATRATYFDSKFCYDNDTRRLLAGDEATALAVSNAQVPLGNATVVIVNTPIYGGAGGGVAWFSTNPDSAEIGIHEMGHSVFGLTDEYGDIYNNYSGSEPTFPNATINTNRATIKWRDLILPATPLPTTNNTDCTRDGPATSPVPSSTVGAFEGAARAHCGAFRPEFECKMRNLNVPFCAVCQRSIRQVLFPEGDVIQCITVELRRVSSERFISTKVIHAIDMSLSRADTESDIFVRSAPNGTLRAVLDIERRSLIKIIDVVG